MSNYTNDTATAPTPFITEVYSLPSFWAVALINDDTSGFTDEDQAQFDAFCADMDTHYKSWWASGIEGDGSDGTLELEYFSDSHDAVYYGVLACNVCDYVIQVVPR